MLRWLLIAVAVVALDQASKYTAVAMLADRPPVEVTPFFNLLLAYNRGEDAVWRDVRAGINPGNGYDRWVLRDYKGKGLLPTQ